jgi:hypothetical protein
MPRESELLLVRVGDAKFQLSLTIEFVDGGHSANAITALIDYGI